MSIHKPDWNGLYIAHQGTVFYFKFPPPFNGQGHNYERSTLVEPTVIFFNKYSQKLVS